MGCSYPIKIENKKYKSGGIYKWQRQRYYFVPCGKCLGCQISKRTWLNTACEYEFNKYGCGSFTTLTYDEEHILKCWNDELNMFVLNYNDFELFMKRLRQNLYRKYGVRHDFKYLAVGEYGGKTGRLHYHVLFFGLDCRNNDLDIWEAWQNGIADNKPIKEGGINYVLKYMDKSEMRRKNSITFRKEEQPFLKHSVGLGKGFIEEHLEDIIKHDGTYDKGDGKRHALPSYWIRKLCIETITDYVSIRKKMVEQHYRNWKGEVKDYKEITKTEAINWSMEKTRLKEEAMIRASRDNGNPQEDFDEFYFRSRKHEIL